MPYISRPISFIYIIVIMILAGCNSRQKEYESPSGYHLSNPFIIKLPSELDGISGIAYYAKDNSLFAESDQKGCLYKIFLNKPTDIRKWKFGHKRDYEDIVLHDSTFYILNNNGDIVSLSFLNDSLITHEFTFSESGKFEFESLYYDDKLQKVVLLCKDCEIDRKTTVSTYSFDLLQFVYASSLVIDVKDVADAIGPTSVKFKPSGASVNPVTGELYILSSVNKLLVITERNGGVKEVYHLDPRLFNQPEGIAFTPNGGLFISNEASADQPATILYYQFKNSTAK